VFIEGDQAETIALLISCAVRVYKIGETGREITLYRFGHGESCILTANAILSRKSFPAIATVEIEAEAVMIPAEVFRDRVKRYDLWRESVFDLLSDRLATVMAVVEEVIFQPLDRRVASLLLSKSKTNSPIRSVRPRAGRSGSSVPADRSYCRLSAVRDLQVQHLPELDILTDQERILYHPLLVHKHQF
jgi:CRP-like cAMP-binding protein